MVNFSNFLFRVTNDYGVDVRNYIRFLIASADEGILYGQLELYLKTYVVGKNFQKQPKCAPDHPFCQISGIGKDTTEICAI
jgi:hypothetical protein